MGNGVMDVLDPEKRLYTKFNFSSVILLLLIIEEKQGLLILTLWIMNKISIRWKMFKQRYSLRNPHFIKHILGDRQHLPALRILERALMMLSKFVLLVSLIFINIAKAARPSACLTASPKLPYSVLWYATWISPGYLWLVERYNYEENHLDKWDYRKIRGNSFN